MSNHMKQCVLTRWLSQVGLCVVAVGLLMPVQSWATVLTFDIYTNAAKTTLYGLNGNIPAQYGDNVTDFSPAASIDGTRYANYGSAGGFTPGVGVGYFGINSVSPFDSYVGANAFWNTGYDTLTNVAYSSAVPGYLSEIRFSIPVTGSVRIDSFDVAKFGAGTLNGLTLKVVQNASSASPITLWQAAADGTVSVSGTQSYAPGVSVSGSSNTISLIWGRSDSLGIDNVQFSLVIPEPASVILALGTMMMCTLSRRLRA